MKKSKQTDEHKAAIKAAEKDFRKTEHHAPLDEEIVKDYCEGRKRNLRFH